MSSDIGGKIILAVARPIAKYIERGSRPRVVGGTLAGGLLCAALGGLFAPPIEKMPSWYLVIPGSALGALAGALVGASLGKPKPKEARQPKDHGVVYIASSPPLAPKNEFQEGPSRTTLLPAGNDPETKESVHEPETSFTGWAAAVLSILVALLGVWAGFEKNQKEWEKNKPHVPQMSRQFEQELRKMQEVDPVVLQMPLPEPGGFDLVEMQLRTKISELTEKKGDPQQIQRLTRSLEYWRERKQKRTPGVIVSATTSARGDLPSVEGANFESLRTHCLQVLEALKKLQSPLPKETHRALRALLQNGAKDPETPAKIQKLLDPHCLIAVTINPESRVKAARGPAPAELAKDQATVVLIKVQNDAGVTHALSISGPQIRTGGKKEEKRWLEAEVHAEKPLSCKLSGQKVEYVIVRLTAHEAGKREATLVFDVGQGTQDLGFRAEVPVLFQVRSRP